MAIRIVQLGGPRHRGEGPRVGTVRRPPRGVPKTQYARRDFYDVWLPELAPSAKLIDSVRGSVGTEAGWRRFDRRYRGELRRPSAQRLLRLLAALSHEASFSVGCYCDDEQRCHRSILRLVLQEHGARIR